LIIVFKVGDNLVLSIKIGAKGLLSSKIDQSLVSVHLQGYFPTPLPGVTMNPLIQVRNYQNGNFIPGCSEYEVKFLHIRPQCYLMKLYICIWEAGIAQLV
jgi:hypothetical protein